jgi:hypothetical protein
MHPKLRAFLEKNGLRADATEVEAWEYHKQIQAGGISYVGPERADVAAPTTPVAPVAAPAAGEQRAAAPAAATAQPAMDPAQIAAAIAADRQRAADIEDVCTYAGMDPQSIRSLVLSGSTVDAARAAALTHMRATNRPLGVGAGLPAQVGMEGRDKLRAAVSDGLRLRCGHRVENPAAGATEFRGRTLVEIVREVSMAAGQQFRGMSNREMLTRAISSMSTSDLPHIFGGLMNTTLLDAYNEWPATWRSWVATGTANDFREMHAVSLSAAPDLKGMNENGEYQTAQFSDAGEAYRIVRKGVRVPFTFEMIINDNLRALSRIPRLFGAAARRLEGDAVYSLLTANGSMSDGVALFHADHANLSAAAALAVDSLDKGRSAMRMQTGLAGEHIDIQPAYLLTPVGLETASDVLLRSASYPEKDYSAGVAQPQWLGKLTPIADPHLDAVSLTAWYLIAHPNQVPFIEASWLEGMEQPFVDEMPDFNSDGIIYKVRHCFGAGIADFRGAHRNPGA